MSLTFPELISIKQRAGILEAHHIEWFVKEVSTGNAHQAQIGAMLMAIFLQGINYTLVQSVVVHPFTVQLYSGVLP